VSPIASMQAVQARMSAIESMVGARRTPVAAQASAAAAPANASSFESLLAQLQDEGLDTIRPGATGDTASALAKALGLRTPPAPAGAATGPAATAGPSPTAGGGGVTGDKVVATAKKYLGVPYLWGGTTPAGFDCSGLIQHVYSELGISLPRVSRDQARAGTAVPSLAQAKPGDLVAFNSPVNHIGIYLGDGMMLDAPRRGQNVKIQKVWATPTAIRRIIPDGGVAAASASAGVAAAAPATAGPVPGTTPFASLFNGAGSRHGVDPRLLAAVARAESSFNPRAVSPAGARGLMQIMPATARGLGVDPMVPEQAVDGAARLLAQHLRSYGGKVELALAAYNAGPGNVAKYGGVPPFKETQGYIRKVMAELGGRS
jgi:peptidoglycan DL-endopeptidase CwlO